MFLTSRSGLFESEWQKKKQKKTKEDNLVTMSIKLYHTILAFFSFYLVLGLKWLFLSYQAHLLFKKRKEKLPENLFPNCRFGVFKLE